MSKKNARSGTEGRRGGGGGGGGGGVKQTKNRARQEGLGDVSKKTQCVRATSTSLVCRVAAAAAVAIARTRGLVGPRRREWVRQRERERERENKRRATRRECVFYSFMEWQASSEQEAAAAERGRCDFFQNVFPFHFPSCIFICCFLLLLFFKKNPRCVCVVSRCERVSVRKKKNANKRVRRVLCVCVCVIPAPGAKKEGRE